MHYDLPLHGASSATQQSGLCAGRDAAILRTDNVGTALVVRACAEAKKRVMDTDHSPFYSDPEGLAAIIDEEARFQSSVKNSDFKLARQGKALASAPHADR